MLVEISKIDMGDRARRDYGDLDALQLSLTKYGQLQNIVLDESNLLRAGGRRLTAAIMLDWAEIEVTYLKDMSPLEQREVELEENIQRKSLTWQEEVCLKQEIEKTKKLLAEANGEKWTREDTEKLLGESKANISKDLFLAQAIDDFPDLKMEKDKSTARTKARRLYDAKYRAVLNTERGIIEGLFHGDCNAILETIDDNSVDLIFCDPPYAIDFEKKERNKSYPTVYGDGYEDKLEPLRSVLHDCLGHCQRVLKPGGHMYLWFAIQYFHDISLELKMHFSDFKDGKSKKFYQSTPLMWVKSSNENYKPFHRFCVNYEPFFFLWKGEQREFAKPSNCAILYEPDKVGTQRHHPAQKPVALYEHLLEVSSYEGMVVLDPFLGSGVSLAVASRMGRKIIGIEKEKDWFELATHNVHEVENK